MNCIAWLFKYILYIINLIFLLLGVLVIVLGSLMISAFNDFGTFDQFFDFKAIPIFVIVIGSIIAIISFIGCCGTIRENACLTMTYAVLMFIVFLLQVALTTWVLKKRTQLLAAMGTAVDKAWQNNDSASGYPMDALQLGLICCGNDGYSDYVDNGNAVPPSCCGYADRTTECPAEIYQTRQPCKEKFVNFWSSNTNIIGYSGIVLAIFELGVFITACCLSFSMRRSRRG